MQAKRGSKPWMAGAEIRHGLPVVFLCSIHGAAGNADAGQLFKKGFTERPEPGIMKVLMGVVIHRVASPSILTAKSCRAIPKRKTCTLRTPAPASGQFHVAGAT